MGENTRPSIRIFLSSTFLDMQKEREFLNQEIFPKLKTKCENLGVSFYAVDLRWGISEKEQEEDRVVDICMREIDNCRPFFIGLVGNRYGWIPTEYNANTLQSFPWLKDYQGKSVTEVEMCYGALNSSSEHVLFYFKEDSLSREDDCDHKLEEISALKERILASGKYTKAYSSIEKLGEDVYTKLSHLIDTLYNQENENISQIKQKYFLSKERETYINNEVFEQVYFDAVVNNPYTPILVHSFRPCGKTVTLNNWIEKQEGGKIVINLKADSSLCAHPYKLFDLIIDGLKENRIYQRSTFEEYGEIFDTVEEEDVNDFAYLRDLLSKLKLRKELYIVINDVDRVFYNPILHSLSFIPTHLPEKLHIICSTNNIKQTSLLSTLGFVTIDVEREARNYIKDAFMGKATGLDIETLAKNLQQDFFPIYLALHGKGSNEDFSEISFFSIYNQKLVADFLIQFSNFESHKKDFNFLVYGKEEKGNAVNDCNFILKNAFERLTADYDEETLYYLSLLILRLKNLEKGLEEDQLFLAFPDEGDTLSLLGFLGNPKYKKNISAIKKAYVMRVLRFFFQSDEGVIKNKDSIISQFITSNANYFASKALPYKKKVLQANFAKTPLSSLNLQGRIISRENFEKVFLTQSQLERVIDYDISDLLSDYFSSKVFEVSKRLERVEDFLSRTEENNKLEDILSEAIRYFIARNHLSGLLTVVTDKNLVLFAYIRNKYLLQKALITYLDKVANGESEEGKQRQLSWQINYILSKLDYHFFEDYKGAVLNCYFSVISYFSLKLVDVQALSKFTDVIYFSPPFYELIEDFASEECKNFFDAYDQLERKAKTEGLDDEEGEYLNQIFATAFEMDSENLVDKYVYSFVACRIAYTFSLDDQEELFKTCCDLARQLANPWFEAFAISLYARYTKEKKSNVSQLLRDFAIDYFVILSSYTEIEKLK